LLAKLLSRNTEFVEYGDIPVLIVEPEGAALKPEQIVQGVEPTILTVVRFLLKRWRILGYSKAVKFLSSVRIHEQLKHFFNK
jgi:hypothetical protein